MSPAKAPPPHDLDAEESALGAALLSRDAAHAIVDVLEPFDFYKPAHGHIFEAIRRLRAKACPIDPVTVADELRRQGTLEAIGDDPAVLIALQNNTPASSNAAHYAEIVLKHAQKRAKLAVGQEYLEAVRRGNDRKELACRAEMIALSAQPGPSDELPVEDVAVMAKRIEHAEPPRHLARPVLVEGDYGVISAEPKAGKSYAAADLALSVASGTPWLGIFEVELPGNVLMFVGEGGSRKLIRRLRAIARSKQISLEKLPVRICLRVPHLTSDTSILDVDRELEAHKPVLVIVDSLYLAARGARGSDLYEMGAHLERIQAVAQRHGAALLVVHHWNKTGEGRGAKRMSGAGVDAWGRFLISALVVNRHTDRQTGASSVTLDLDIQGDEIAEQTVRIRRRVWADDPHDVTSDLHYEVEQLDTETDEDPMMTDLRPSAVRVLRMLERADNWLNIREIGDVLAIDDTGLSPLRPRTIQAALDQLKDADMAESTSILGSNAQRWRARPVRDVDSGISDALDGDEHVS